MRWPLYDSRDRTAIRTPHELRLPKTPHHPDTSRARNPAGAGCDRRPECTCHLPNTARFDYANFHDNHNETIGLK